ncbi:MAG: hypothetical protein COA97_01645 [Flavobacteriales bacterium]|nr:MAG: hypothetical protein COA97_01645 [Flavobacteriales bacterium]
MKRIVICSDGTWNKPEEDLEKDFPTNVLKFSRAIKPIVNDKVVQTVFYDWGIGSYHSSTAGGAFGQGLDKNIKDCYRFIVHNYEKGDELFFFGFSRGAYTVRSLCGFINNCSILKKENAKMISGAFNLYKNSKFKVNHPISVQFRKEHTVSQKIIIKFVGVWDTVGSMGLPTSIFGFIKPKNLFYDNKIGSNIETARHALAIEEVRKDFEPTIWKQDSQNKVDLKQVWFAGNHSDVGGSYQPDKDGRVLSETPLLWMKKEAEAKGLKFQTHINVKPNVMASSHNEQKKFYKLLGKHVREILTETPIHISVKKRYTDISKAPQNLKDYVSKYGWNNIEN